MRDKLIEGLNELLEIDHDATSGVFLSEMDLPIGSSLSMHPGAYAKAGVRVISALSLLNQCTDEDPINPVIENGVIQRFE